MSPAAPRTGPRSALSALRRLSPRGADSETPMRVPTDVFWSSHYVRHNQRRLEHLASLRLPIAGVSVLEVGAGIGDHTSFFLDRGCRVVPAEPRGDNLALLRKRYPGLRIEQLDLDDPGDDIRDRFEIVYCYGTLYHLQRPAEAIAFMSKHCSGMLLLETCVSRGDTEEINLVSELEEDQSQSIHGMGCRPTRPWVFNRLKEQFSYVYMPTTQPWHEEFPLRWDIAASPGVLTRSVFIASRTPLTVPGLVEEIPSVQVRA